MTVSPTPTPAGAPAPQVGLTEWFGQRRYPMPQVYRSLAELPATLAALIAQALPAGQEVQAVLCVPAEYRPRIMLGWEYVPERALVFLPAAALYVRAAGPKTPAETAFLAADRLLYVRSSLLLLYGLLELKADCGLPAGAVRLEYNTVIWQALRGPLGQFVAAASAPASRGANAEVRAANEVILRTLPYKFANGVRYYALEPGERLLAAVFQPGIWERRALLRVQVTPNTLLALTEDKVVCIEEQRATFWGRKPPSGEYGWIFTYIPRDRVVDMVMTPRERQMALQMDLQWGGATDRRTFLFEPAVAADWERAWRAA